MKVQINNGRLLDSSNTVDAVGPLCIDGGVIVGVGHIPDGFVADQQIDATNKIVCPGFVDLAYSLREPGFKHQGPANQELKAAARAGYARVCALPDTSPVNDSQAVTNLILDIAEKAAGAKVLPLGALTQGLRSEKLSNMHGLRDAGCVAMSNGDQPLSNLSVLRRCLQYAATHGITVFLRPEEASFSVVGGVHEGGVCTRLGLPPMPEVAETLAVSQILLLAEDTGARVHLSQISTGRSVKLIAEAKNRGVLVTVDVALHQLIFTEEAVDGFDGLFHVRPPLRSESDRQALIEGVASGVIDAICSRHQPLDAASKQAPFAETVAGLATIEMVVPELLKLANAGNLTLETALRAVSVNPARIIGLPIGLSEESVADVVVVDPVCEWIASSETLLSTASNNPWMGQVATGRVSDCLIEGIPVV